MSKNFSLMVFSYMLISFATGFIWHLVLFKQTYQNLGVYNLDQPIFAFGIGSMLIQALVIAYLFPRQLQNGATLADGFKFAAVMGAFMWSLTALATAAKTPIDDLGTWFMLVSGYHLLQFALVGIALGLIYRPRHD
jgi:hypothetical protein